MIPARDLSWMAAMAEDYERQAERGRRWRAHFARFMPPGRERRSKLRTLSFHANRLDRRANFLRAVVAHQTREAA